MDAQMLKSLELLDEFFAQTPSEELNAMFDKYNHLLFEGQSVPDYLNTFDLAYTIELLNQQGGTFNEIKPDTAYSSPRTQIEHPYNNIAGYSNYALAA
jgi:hypothetical protein